MATWVIKNKSNLYLLECPSGKYWTSKNLTCYKSKEEASFVISILRLKGCKPVKVRIEEVEE